MSIVHQQTTINRNVQSKNTTLESIAGLLMASFAISELIRTRQLGAGSEEADGDRSIE
jgi:hypothetical protein